MSKKIILSGMRPTGKCHIGQYVGALENWVKLQNDYNSYHFIADYHALTTNLETKNIYQNTIDLVIDWLASGLDPEKVVMFRQSQIKEHSELYLIFSMLMSTSRLERNPTLKEQIRDLNIENTTIGYLGYPVLQAADILIYRAHAVPVGEDQIPHVEITREMARKFNTQYGEVFPVPEPLLTTFPRLAGLDGSSKMSKSMNNAISLSDGPDVVIQKLKKAKTDPQKMRKNDPGRPEVCLVFSYQKKFNPGEIEEIEKGCRSGELGCVDCKLKCSTKINEILAPILEKRKYYEENLDKVTDVLTDGEQRARKVAVATMEIVRTKMNMG